MVKDIEYMGFGWMGQVKKYMVQRLKYLPDLKELAKNDRLLNNIHSQYMAMQASGYKAADIASGSGDFVKWTPGTYAMAREIADNLNVPQLLILNYFLAIYNLAAAGKIPLEKWNPKEYEEKKRLQKTLSTEKSIWSKGGKAFGRVTGRLMLPVAIIGGLVGYAVLSDKMKAKS